MRRPPPLGRYHLPPLPRGGAPPLGDGRAVGAASAAPPPPHPTVRRRAAAAGPAPAGEGCSWRRAGRPRGGGVGGEGAARRCRAVTVDRAAPTMRMTASKIIEKKKAGHGLPHPVLSGGSAAGSGRRARTPAAAAAARRAGWRGGQVRPPMLAARVASQPLPTDAPTPGPIFAYPRGTWTAGRRRGRWWRLCRDRCSGSFGRRHPRQSLISTCPRRYA